MNILYVVPDLNKVSGGPRTRITMFKNVFIKNGGVVIENGDKLFKSIKPRKLNLVYVESATNRVGLLDVVSLFFLRLYSKRVTVFIRDIYIELFPEEYKKPRKKITLILNKISNFYLALIATDMVFPTKDMGKVFFEKNNFYPSREYTDLPPGTLKTNKSYSIPSFNKKVGILYLGSTKYANAGFDKFIDFSRAYSKYYNFFVLSGDKGLASKFKEEEIAFDKVVHSEIPSFIKNHNIAFAIHTRPRNLYDDLTFPIKVLDFVAMQLPFFSERHVPIVKLLGESYPLFYGLTNQEKIHLFIQNMDEETYTSVVEHFKEVTSRNSYDKRYKKLLSQQ
ncbi:hypothetical protein M4I21_16020 [Cellulophaga sp. 20_2_10]|uniref:hypothetical protein n=1 Tax=Cellulophaga sp. 20_2_10 TaxID=2942476 RepID=UPI00201A817A|nr:hypothetical protein [Cellulophaga sp. 20_2_10]MCL5247330.1 hypothetical protein [Cellulophaga sp. 20_2_10]